MIINDIVKYLETKYPLNIAYEWDKVGLQVGSKNAKVSKVLISLDLTLDVVEEAIRENASMIITHHPFIFSAIKTISFDSVQGKMLMALLQNKISVYSLHTNYDIAEGGMNDILAHLLSLENTKPLEMINDSLGLGRVGNIKELELSQCIEMVKEKLNLKHVRFIGDVNKKVKRIAICGGSGSSLAFLAKKEKADLLITGDVKYHDALNFKEIGINVLDIGHHVESLFAHYLANELEEQFNEVEFVVSSNMIDPFITL